MMRPTTVMTPRPITTASLRDRSVEPMHHRPVSVGAKSAVKRSHVAAASPKVSAASTPSTSK
jgi:hypothetical protein